MNENIVLVTGMSGAGKSSAMNALEDLGYYCIDNFPKELLPNLEELLEKKARNINPSPCRYRQSTMCTL